MRAQALELIKRCIKKKDEYLDIGNCGLIDGDFHLGGEIDMLLSKCVHLTRLTLSNSWNEFSKEVQTYSTNVGEKNRLSKIPRSVFKLNQLKEFICCGDSNAKWHIESMAGIEELSKLEILNLSFNYITGLAEIGELNSIKQLNLSYNRISTLYALKNLKNLEKLNIEANVVGSLDYLAELINLNELYTKRNRIETLVGLNKLLSLEILDISNNNLSTLNGIESLKGLARLSIGSNRISSLDYLKHLTNINAIDLSGNNIGSIEELLPFLTSQKPCHIVTDTESYRLEKYEINIAHNPITIPPIAIVDQGNNAIINYFDAIKYNKTQYLYEAKLLIIGEGGTGKTTFARKMVDVNAELPEDKDTTLGIDVGKWSYQVSTNEASTRSSFKFNVNLWDFGGQKIYQGTHQIFFSDKSFYVLIADTREQKTDFSYWLNTVEQVGGDSSSLVIILNKKYEHEQRFDERGYRNRFGNIIKDVIQLDLKNDINDLRVLQERIKNHLQMLPDIGDRLPQAWVNIREDLLKEKVNFISFDQFLQLCKKREVKDVALINTLSSYFNRIGVFTHYNDDALLRERIYLNSNWLVKTVYKVLDNQLAKNKKGRLTITDIQTIWGDNELHFEVNKLTQLMHKFGLMYQIAQSDSYVVPAHLPTITPYFRWPYADRPDILLFKYEFDKYMPQGIMSRIIVALNHHIRDQEYVWHRGVNIELNGSQAEIIESYGEVNRFEIRIAGVNKIELLSVIREHFSQVLKPFKNLKYNQLLPCICEECRNSAEPAPHDYNQVLNYREKGTGSQCKKTGVIINAEELLKTIGNRSGKDIVKEQFKRKTIKIFLASSSELIEDRKAIREFISLENDRLDDEGIYLKLYQWEYFIDAMSKDGLQSEYNKAVKESDIFLSLFFSKVGKFTAEEFEKAFGQFKNTGKPLVYTYFKNAPINSEQIKKADVLSKSRFEEKLVKLKHFKTIYSDINDLKNQIKSQLERVIPLINN